MKLKKKKKKLKLTKEQIILFSSFIVLFVIILIIGINQIDNSYVKENDLKINKFENGFVVKGYLNRIDDDTKQVDYNDYELVDVTYEITKANVTPSTKKGYTRLDLEYTCSGNTYYGYDKNNNIKNMGYYSFYTLDFYDKYSGIQFWFNSTDKLEKNIKYKGKEYKIYYLMQELPSYNEEDWTGVNNLYFIRSVSQKYLVTIEYPSNYDGLIMGATGANNGYNNDMNLSKALSKKESVYMLDSINKDTKLFKVEDIIKELN